MASASVRDSTQATSAPPYFKNSRGIHGQTQALLMPDADLATQGVDHERVLCG